MSRGGACRRQVRIKAEGQAGQKKKGHGYKPNMTLKRDGGRSPCVWERARQANIGATLPSLLILFYFYFIFGRGWGGGYSNPINFCRMKILHLVQKCTSPKTHESWNAKLIPGFFTSKAFKIQKYGMQLTFQNWSVGHLQLDDWVSD